MPLEVLAHFTGGLGRAADLPQQLRLTGDVLRRALGDVTVTFFTRAENHWQPVTWPGQAHPDQVEGSLPADSPLLIRVFEEQRPVFFEEGMRQPERRGLGLVRGGALYPYFHEGLPCGLLSVALPAGRGWTDQERAVFQVVGGGLALAFGRDAARDRRRNPARQKDDGAAALEVFAAFTERAAAETDVLALSREAYAVMDAHFSEYSSAYYEIRDGLWKALTWTSEMTPGQIAMTRPGLALDTPSFRRALDTRQPVFIDGWDAARERIENSDDFGPVCIYPLVVGQEVRGILTVGLRVGETWRGRDRGLMRALGRSLTLALERAEQTRQLDEERAALAAFTAFTESVGSETDVLALIRQAAAVLAEAHDVDVTYSEREGEVFRLRVWPTSFPEDLRAEALAGYRPSDPGFEEAQRTGQSVFLEDIDGRLDGRPGVALYRALAFQPFFQGETMTGMLIMASRRQGRWPERQRAVFRAVGRSLGLALERAEGVRRLARSNAELQVAVGELEAFAYSVSHDLRTPVRHIKGFNALLRARIADPPDLKVSHYLSVIDDAAGRMNILIDAMLDLSRTTRQPLRVEDVELAELVTSVQVELTAEAEDRSRPLEWRVGTLPQVSGDRHLLRQVLVNLLSNAVKYTRTRAQSVIEVWAEQRPGEWAVLVRDNGVGFDPRYTDRLFGVFQRLHHEREFEGTGVGLATVRRIVSRHGGTVAAQTGDGAGATFSFTLPRGN
ncbi:ATP-binding protein [Deinococcus frigens]